MNSRFQFEYEDYHGTSHGRQVDRRVVLQQLADHAGCDLDDCDATNVKQYLASLLDEGQHVNTVAKKLSMIVPYFAWGWEAGFIDADRLLAIRALKPPRGSTKQGKPRPYSRKELDRFREALDERWPKVDPKWWARWRRGTSRFRRIQPEAMRIQIEAIVALALHCGLRRDEIRTLAIDDFHYDNAYVVVRQRGERENGKDHHREVPHTRGSREAVRAWLELRAELDPKHDDPWLCLAHEAIATAPMRDERFRGLLTTIPRGPTEDMSHWRYHRFRHTAGTEWLRATKRIEIVQRMLGHSNIQQTLGYASIVRDDLHEALGKAEGAFDAAVGRR